MLDGCEDIGVDCHRPIGKRSMDMRAGLDRRAPRNSSKSARCPNTANSLESFGFDGCHPASKNGLRLLVSFVPTQTDRPSMATHSSRDGPAVVGCLGRVNGMRVPETIRVQCVWIR